MPVGLLGTVRTCRTTASGATVEAELQLGRILCARHLAMWRDFQVQSRPLVRTPIPPGDLPGHSPPLLPSSPQQVASATQQGAGDELEEEGEFHGPFIYGYADCAVDPATYTRV